MTLFYIHPRETWDEEKCKKIAKRVARDGMGTKMHFPGYIGSCIAPYGWGKTRYNGGCVRDGEWYDGEIRRLPRVAKGFKIVKRPTWGYQLVKVEDESDDQVAVPEVQPQAKRTQRRAGRNRDAVLSTVHG